MTVQEFFDKLNRKKRRRLPDAGDAQSGDDASSGDAPPGDPRSEILMLDPDGCGARGPIPVKMFSVRFFHQKQALDMDDVSDRTEYLFKTPDGHEILKNAVFLDDDPIQGFLFMVGHLFGRAAPERFRSGVIILTHKGQYKIAWKSQDVVKCHDVTRDTVFKFLRTAYNTLKRVLVDQPDHLDHLDQLEHMDHMDMAQIQQLNFLNESSPTIIIRPTTEYVNDDDRRQHTKMCTLSQLLHHKKIDHQISKTLVDMVYENVLHTIGL